MSWFDNSFSFARTALSQAQKSIDKVLDIRGEEGAALDPAEPGPPSSSSAVSKSSDEKPKTSPKFSTSTPKPSSSKSPQSSQAPPSPQRNSPLSVSPSQDNFSSTWGGTWGKGDSLWGSSLTTPPASKTEPVSQKEKPSSSSAGQGDRAGVSTLARKSRVAKNKRREGSASSLESLSLPSSNPPGSEETKETPRAEMNGDSEICSLGLSPGSTTQQTSTIRDTQSQNFTTERTEAFESSIVGSGELATEVPSTATVLQAEPSAKVGTEGEGTEIQTRVDGSRHSPTGTWDKLSSTCEPVGRGGSAGGGDERETDRGEEGEGEVGVNLIPPTEATDGIDHEAKTHTFHGEEGNRELRPTSTSPHSNHSNMPGTQPHLSSPREERWTEVPLNQAPETAETSSGDSSHPIGSTDTPSEDYRPSPPHTVTPSPVLPSNSPLPISHSPSLPASPPPPSPTETSPLPSTSTVLEPTNTPDIKLADENVSLPQQQSLEATQLSTNDGSDGMGELLHDQELRSVDVKSVENKGGQLKEGSRDSGILVSSGDSGAVQQELVRVNKLLEARETKMVEMSREVIQLSETNQELQSRLSAAEQDLHTSQGGVDDLRSEFTKRIGTTEKKLQTIVKERDSLKKQLQVLTTEQSQQRRSASQELSLLLKEKEEQISGLMEEGEKLSKKELQNSNIIKKLKEKNKQNDQLLMAQRQQIEDCEREFGRLKELVKKKEDNEKKYQESLSQLNSIAEEQEKELTALKTERDELTDKARSLQTNLDNAYKELSALHKVTAVSKSTAHEAVLSAEQTARQELTEALEKQRVEHHREKQQLLLEISELRANVSRCEQQSAWREERMKQEVSDVQQRLQEAEMRNQELTTTISQTTKPFLRQIETLRSAHSAQTANWEKVEADITHRLVEAQTQLSAAVEKERSATEKALTLQSRITHLERQTASLRQERSRLAASLELEKAKAETLEESQQRESAKMEALRSSMQQSLEELRKEKEMLERQLEYERVRLEAESRKACLESQEKERLRSQLASSLSRGLSRQSSTASTTHTQSEILEKSLVQQLSEDARGGGSVSDSGTGFYHGRIPPTSASAMEQLQSLLKQKEGELANAQTLVGSLERSRAAMANDLAAVSSQNVDLTEKVEAIPHLKNHLQELQKKNEALLQMYGEKAEKAEELRLDIVDLKEMYKQQIDALTQR